MKPRNPTLLETAIAPLEKKKFECIKANQFAEAALYRDAIAILERIDASLVELNNTPEVPEEGDLTQILLGEDAWTLLRNQNDWLKWAPNIAPLPDAFPCYALLIQFGEYRTIRYAYSEEFQNALYQIETRSSDEVSPQKGEEVESVKDTPSPRSDSPIFNTT